MIKVNSLKSRLVISALLMVVVLLPLVGFALFDAFSQQVKRSAENELKAYLYSILAVAEVEQGQLWMPEVLPEPRFNLPESGLYAWIAPRASSQTSAPLWHSGSYLFEQPPRLNGEPQLGQGHYQWLELEQVPHLVYRYTAAFESAGQSLDVTLNIAVTWQGYQQQLDIFAERLIRWIGGLILVLLLVQLAWLNWTLKPLAQFRRQLAQVESGELNQLSTRYPQELSVVASQLNALLTAEQQQRNRYRNSLSDLAHSMKTPLAVIRSQSNLDSAIAEQVQRLHEIIDHQCARAQTAGASAWHQGVELSQVIAPLQRSLEKIHAGSGKTLTLELDPKLKFRGDEGDLMELLGNLLDNAFKAANTQVRLSAKATANQLTIIVEDDGPGITESRREEIFARGKRADTYQQGHGIGLAIVRDLVEDYQGQLVVERSSALGGASFTLNFPL